MTWNLKALIPLVWFVPAVTAQAESEPAETESLSQVEAHVYYCHDGDTCRVRVANAMWVSVRLAGIDAPEVASRGGRGKKKNDGQSMGQDAKDFLNKSVQGKNVLLRQVDLDPYNRPVVVLESDGKAINIRLIEEGLAEVYRGKTKRLDKAPYLDAEEKAKKEKKGIWSLANYESPAAFRKEMKR
jgi:endonuclease YncB( thermonuclease family)